MTLIRPIRIALNHLALALAFITGAVPAPRAQALTYDFNNATLQGWNNRVWNGSAWIDLAPNATTY